MSAKTNNPYVGPRTFQENERDRFFGREREARDLLALAVSEQLVLFYAQSGAGKSSLVNTCLIPDLRNKGFEIFPGRVAGDAPKGIDVNNIYVFNLIRSMIPGEVNLDWLARITISEYFSKFASDGARTDPASDPMPHVLIIDQFEELFSTHHEAWEKREVFFQQLAKVMEDDPYLWVVLVMREDFIAALDPYAYILPSRLRMRYYMQRLERDSALDAIKKPVKDLRPFDSGVAETLVDNLARIKIKLPDGTPDEQPGQYIEPVQLQVVCYSLWENLEDGKFITEGDLQKVGDVDQALENFYDERVRAVAKEKKVEERLIREWFDNELITSSGTRNMVLRNLISGGNLNDNVIQALQGDLVRAEMRAGQTWYELSHDRLIEPIQASNTKWFADNLSMFQQQAALWAAQGRPEGMLLRGKELELAEEEQRKRVSESKTISQDELDFLAACIKARDREQRERKGNLLVRALAVVATISLIVAVALAFQSLNNAKNANSARQAAEVAGAIAETQAANANAQAATATYSLGQVAALSGLVEAEALSGQAQIALGQSATIQLGRLLSVEAYNKNRVSGEILPSVYQALINSIAEGNDLLLDTRPFSSASFSFDGGEKRLVVDNDLWNLKDVQVTKLDLDSSQVVYSAFLSNEEMIIITPNTDYYSSDQNPYNVNLVNITNQEKTQIQLTVPEKAYVVGMGLSDNSRWVGLMFGASKNGGVRLWDTKNPEQEPKQLFVQYTYVRDVAISPDSTNVALVDDNYLYLWQKDERGLDKQGNLLADFALDTGFVNGRFSGKSGRGLQFSPDGRWLAMQTRTNIRVFDPTTQRLISGTPQLTKEEISGFLFSPDSRYLVYVVKNTQYTAVLRWSPEDANRAPHEIYRSTTADVTAMDIGQNGKLVIGDEAGYVRVWNVSQDSQEPLLVASVHAGRIANLLIGPDEQTVISASEVDGTRLWNLTESESEAVIEYRIPSTVAGVVRVDGDSLAIGGIHAETDSGVVHVYSNLPSPDPVAFDSDLGSSLQTLAVSGKWIAAGRMYQRYYYSTPSYFLDFWERNSSGGESRVISFTMPSRVSSLAFYGDQYLVIAVETGELWIDDTADLKRLLDSSTSISEEGASLTGVEIQHKLPLPNDLTDIQSLMFAQNGRYLIGAGAGGVRVWDTSQLSKSQIYQLPNAVSPALVSPDEKWLVTAGSDNTVQVYNLGNITSSPVVIPVGKSFVTRFAFNRRGDQLAVANKVGEIAIYQLPVTKYPVIPIYTFQGSSGEITWLEFSPAGSSKDWLVASSGSEVYLWNTNRLNDKAVTLQSNSKVVYVSFTNDNEWIITLSTDQTLRFWSMDLEKMSTTACIYAGRNLTRVEWNRYLPGKGDLQETCPGLDYSLEQKQTITESDITPTAYPTSSILLPTPIPSPTPQPEFVTYVIKEGDTLGGVAAKFGIDLNTLMQDNKITNPNIVVLGQPLRIRVPASPGTP